LSETAGSTTCTTVTAIRSVLVVPVRLMVSPIPAADDLGDGDGDGDEDGDEDGDGDGDGDKDGDEEGRADAGAAPSTMPRHGRIAMKILVRRMSGPRSAREPRGNVHRKREARRCAPSRRDTRLPSGA
jgi:hypothetical protein